MVASDYGMTAFTRGLLRQDMIARINVKPVGITGQIARRMQRSDAHHFAVVETRQQPATLPRVRGTRVT
jgi:hypothetical protein